MTPTEIVLEIVAPSIVAMLGGNTLLTWWLQTRFEHRLKKEMAEHEAKLSQQNFRFSTVFTTTEKTIAELYALLLPVLDAAEDYTMLMSDRTPEQKKGKIKEFSERCNAFFAVFRPKKIYVPKDTATQLNDLMHTTIHMVRVYNRSETLLKMEPLTKEGREVLEKMDNQVEEMQQKLSPLLLKLESEFQEILGFPKHTKE
jgi:hypothetical protein